MKHYSRAQWAQIKSRVAKVQGVFDPGWLCIICGKKFRVCTEHDVSDNIEVIALAKARG